MSTRWFRFYEDAVDDPKVQRLPGPLFKTWVNMLCIASRNSGRLPPLDDLAFALRMERRSLVAAVASLKAAGLLDDDGKELSPHNWSGRQFKSDDVTERVRKYREKAKSNVSGNGGETFHGTAPDNQKQRSETELINHQNGCDAARETLSPVSFPADGAINYSPPFADIARRYGHGVDINLLASAFRKFCHGNDIDFADPQIARKFQTFCGKHKLSRAA